jgi:hypothetical protein
MKDKLKNYVEIHNELKNHCYELSNKWSKYRKSLDIIVQDWECHIYDYSNMNINDLDFEYEDGSFKIGYEFTDRCGDTDYFYTYFSINKIENEDLIKEEIDKIYEKLKKKKEKELEEAEKKKIKEEEEKKKREYELYKSLKEKFENQK